MEKLRLMSNNQWKNDANLPAWKERGLDCSAKVRAKGFADVYESVLPDVVGLQEVSPCMAEELMTELYAKGLTYALIWGKDTPIIYRTDKFEVVDSSFLLYSEKVPNLDGKFNNEKTKSYAVAVFRKKSDGTCFVFATTHLWWMSSNPEKWHYYPNSDEAREYQIKLVVDKVGEFCKKYSCSSVLVGDFNTTADSKAVKYVLNSGFYNAHEVATKYACSDNGLHPCGNNGFEPYEPKDFSFAIDHIFVKGEIKVDSYCRFISNAYLALSDHFPVYIDVEI